MDAKKLIRKPGGMTCSVEGCDKPAQKFPMPTLPDGKLGAAVPLCDEHCPPDGKFLAMTMMLEYETLTEGDQAQ